MMLDVRLCSIVLCRVADVFGLAYELDQATSAGLADPAADARSDIDAREPGVSPFTIWD